MAQEYRGTPDHRYLCEQRRTLKQFILEQDYGRVQSSVRTARRRAECEQSTARVQQPYPLRGPRIEAPRVFRPEVRAADVLAMRHPALALVGEAGTGQIQQQLVQRN